MEILDKSKVKILIVDDEPPIREIMAGSLRDEGYDVKSAHDGQSGLVMMAEYKPDICFLDIWMPGNMDGMAVLAKAKSLYPDTQIVMISGHGTIETAVKATKLGAWDFIEKPLSMDKIYIVIANILAMQSEREEKTALLNKLRKSIALIGEAPSIVQVKTLISRVAPTSSWVLLTGENGSGKELIAQNIHFLSPRASRSFVELNCNSIPEDLLESEIFGIEKGAIPGVDKSRKGRIELADGGTLFIDEIQSMTPHVQARLFKFMQEKKFTRVGSSDVIEADVRVIAASSKDMDIEIKEGRFREDFYYGLNVIPFKIPSLREHTEDIPVLVSHFSDQLARVSGVAKKVFSEQAISLLKSYSWPGNVRELRNFVERIYILTNEDFVDVHDVRFAGMGNQNGLEVASEDLGTFREARAKFEKEYLVRKIQENGGNISKTAETIGLERSYLHRKIKTYGIEVE